MTDKVTEDRNTTAAAPPSGAAAADPAAAGEHPKARYVKKMFNTIATHYDAMNMVMSAGTLRYWQHAFQGVTGLGPGGHALDVACGTAELSLKMAAQVRPGGKVTGIDFSEAMMAIGRKKVEASPYGSMITLQFGDAMDIGFPDDTFDAASIGFALRNVADIPRVLAEMTRVVKPGGHVISLELSKPENAFIRVPYYFYFFRLVPLIDRMVGLGKDEQRELHPYAYLPASLRPLPGRLKLAEMFREAGLVDVKTRPLTGGLVCLHWGVKPPAEKRAKERAEKPV